MRACRTLVWLLALSPALFALPAYAHVPPAPRGEHEELRHELEDLKQRVDEHDAENSLQPAATGIVGATPRIAIHGFFDVELRRIDLPEKLPGRDLVHRDSTFGFGHLNVYLDAQLAEDWRFLGELGFMLNPVGDTARYEIPGVQAYERVGTTSDSPSEYGKDIEMGSIAVERAWVEWAPRDELKLTAGLFLTPFGIWNVDHGSPTRLTIYPPFFYGTAVPSYPVRQLGLKLHGALHWQALSFEYALTISNGRGPAANLVDDNEDKALGARVGLRGAGKAFWHLSLWGFTGRFTDFKELFVFDPVLDIRRRVTVAYREHVIGGDWSVEVGPFLWQVEGMANFRLYDDGHRPPPGLIDRARDPTDPREAPDQIAWGVFSLLAYRLPISGLDLRPYVALSLTDINDNYEADDSFGILGGFNWHIEPNVVLKLEHQVWHWLHDSDEPMLFVNEGVWHMIGVQLAVAF